VEALHNEKTTVESENKELREEMELNSEELRDLREQYRILG
jgi:hypothetical protein